MQLRTKSTASFSKIVALYFKLLLQRKQEKKQQGDILIVFENDFSFFY